MGSASAIPLARTMGSGVVAFHKCVCCPSNDNHSDVDFRWPERGVYVLRVKRRELRGVQRAARAVLCDDRAE